MYIKFFRICDEYLGSISYSGAVAETVEALIHSRYFFGSIPVCYELLPSKVVARSEKPVGKKVKGSVVSEALSLSFSE
jgi:hypothetical protein